ncbi:hypothetical protein R1flu_029270 [Riccia fluitans]|uniref:Uncharacterized protein n=1 Tax=Riccia fluitans TaxID=41844 RepID=A0ABD1XP23_9MARC
MLEDSVQKVRARVRAMENWEPGKRCHRQPTSSHSGRRANGRPGIQTDTSNVGDSEYPGPHGSDMIPGCHRQTSRHHQGEEENTMAGPAPATKKPKKQEDQGKTAGPGTNFTGLTSSRGKGQPGGRIKPR